MGEIVYNKVTTIIVLNKEELSKVDKDGSTVLHKAVKRRELYLIHRILKLKKDLVHAVDIDGCTPLHYAPYISLPNGFRKLHSRSIAKILLDAGANIDAKNIHGYTTLHRACSLEDVDLALYLCEQGANLDLLTTDGVHAMHLISTSTSLISAMIKEYGIDVNMLHEATNITALYIACMRGSFEMVRTLLRLGADWTICNVSGVSPFDIACVGGYIEIAQMIHKKSGSFPINPKEGNLLHLIAEKYSPKHQAVLEYLLINRVDPNAVNTSGKTPFHIIVRSSSFAFTEFDLFIGHGADHRIKDSSGRTPEDYVKSEVGKILFGLLSKTK